ncbi:hypothetical protein [Paenibacillus sp. GCM10027626]|uniref:hypothetical protein n=1 Tax=Paenibacillus sp. GCM10027626 TaxID=3273411 RepID=UPI00362C2992
MRNKLAWLLLCLLLLTLLIAACSNRSFHSSGLEKDFPVPSQAKLVDNGKSSESYTLTSLKEEEGLPEYYRAEIEDKGWKEVDRMGGKYVFAKDGRKLNLVIVTEKFELEKVQ